MNSIRFAAPIVLLVIAVVASSAAADPEDSSPPEIAPAFLSAGELYVRPDVVERPGEDVFAWGRRTLEELQLEGLPADQTARRIARSIHESFAFTPARLPELSDFLDTRAGNCYAHARLGAFLLRLAGIPSRFMYEVHLEHKSPAASQSARERGIGLFGHYHNDHFWVLYHDGNRWTPFDSTLGIADYDDFIRVKIDSPQGGVANPPFLLWQETADPSVAMENVTAAFWREVGLDTLPGVDAGDWRVLLETVGRLEVGDLMRPLSAEHEETIARVARPFFGVENAPGD